jgi:hypothetical protein
MSHDNRIKIDEQMELYREIGDEAAASLAEVTSDTGRVGVMTTATTSTVGEFDTLKTGVPFAARAGASKSPDRPASRVASAENTSDSVFADAESTGAGGGFGAASEADPPETEVPPAFTMPTLSEAMSRASQASAQVAQFSENASKTVGVVGDAVGVVGQVTSMAPSATSASAGAATAPVEDAVVADDGAAAGAEGAERAPVDVAAGGTEQAYEPSPVERVL